MCVLLVIMGIVIGHFRCEAATNPSPNCTEIYSVIFAAVVIVSGYFALRSDR